MLIDITTGKPINKIPYRAQFDTLSSRHEISMSACFVCGEMV
jgi:hypothetical protein